MGFVGYFNFQVRLHTLLNCDIFTYSRRHVYILTNLLLILHATTAAHSGVIPAAIIINVVDYNIVIITVACARRASSSPAAR